MKDQKVAPFDECEAAARDRREAPGLTGQVAWAWEMVERLESAADRLAVSLAGELSVAGVERRVADARARAAEQVAVAQRERAASQEQAETAWREAASARNRAETAERDAASALADARRARDEREEARREAAEAKERAERASAARLAAERERDHVTGREGELLAALEAARRELVTLHARLSEAGTLLEGQKIEATAARRAAEDLRAAVRDAETKRGQAVADRDQMQARTHDLEQHNRRLSRALEDHRAALTADRDAEARPPSGVEARPANGVRRIDEEPPTGLHSLADLNPASLNDSRTTRNDIRALGRINGDPTDRRKHPGPH